MVSVIDPTTVFLPFLPDLPAKTKNPICWNGKPSVFIDMHL
jgi:hypothetical protein